VFKFCQMGLEPTFPRLAPIGADNRAFLTLQEGAALSADHAGKEAPEQPQTREPQAGYQLSSGFISCGKTIALTILRAPMFAVWSGPLGILPLSPPSAFKTSWSERPRRLVPSEIIERTFDLPCVCRAITTGVFNTLERMVSERRMGDVGFAKSKRETASVEAIYERRIENTLRIPSWIPAILFRQSFCDLIWSATEQLF